MTAVALIVACTCRPSANEVLVVDLPGTIPPCEACGESRIPERIRYLADVDGQPIVQEETLLGPGDRWLPPVVAHKPYWFVGGAREGRIAEVDLDRAHERITELEQLAVQRGQELYALGREHHSARGVLEELRTRFRSPMYRRLLGDHVCRAWDHSISRALGEQE